MGKFLSMGFRVPLIMSPTGTLSQVDIRLENKNDAVKDRAHERYIVEVARNFMHDNFSNKICVEEIAKKAFVSQYHFSRIFKKYTHYSPYQYLLNLRLEHSRMLMVKTQLSIKEITFRAGFSSIDYFSSAFTKRYKSCPSIYRKTVVMMSRLADGNGFDSSANCGCGM